MARRKKQRKARKKFTGLNVLSLAEGYVQSNIWTEKMFRTNPIEFATGIVDGTFNPGGDGGNVITIPEIVGFGSRSFNQSGGNFGSYANDLTGAVARNISGKTDANAYDVGLGLVMPAIQTALVGAGFKWGKALTSRPRSAVNRQLKMLGLGQMIRV